MIKIYLAKYRGLCAGVQRSIEIVESALEKYGAPIYVKHWIVHNTHIVQSLEKMGVIFVHKIQDIPPGANVILSAHGSEKHVKEQILSIPGTHVIDAVCPLVLKVHSKIHHYVAMGYFICIIGNNKHQEIKGAVSRIPEGQYQIISSIEDIKKLPSISGKVTYVTQTTLSHSYIKPIVQLIKEKFPHIKQWNSDDICFATTNRQQSVLEIAKKVDMFIIIGSKSSSNSNKLVDIAKEGGCAYSFLIEDYTYLPIDKINENTSIGMSAGASAPEYLLDECIQKISNLYSNVRIFNKKEEEDVFFKKGRI